MGWIKLSSIFFLIIFVIFLTLGGREFFEYFDVDISKKKSDQALTQTQTIKEELDNDQRNKDVDKNKSSDSKDDNWSEFN